MSLAPLADVVAYLDRNTSRLATVSRSLDAVFDVVWSPHGGCVLATRALPRSVPDGDDLRAAGLAFAEGRNSLGAASPANLALESLSGDVGFTRTEGHQLVVVRSGAGAVPWYAWQDGERALVSTSFTELVRLLPVTPRLDPLVCGMWVSGNPTFPDGRTFLEGIVAIPPGHTADVRPGRRVSPRPWWNPWPEELAWPGRNDRADHVRRFRDAVLTALDREVADEPVNLLTLSGGVDSGALAYLVGRRLGRPLAALSLVPPPDSAEARLADWYLNPIVAELGIAPHVRQTSGAAERLTLLAGTPPVAFPVFHPALQMLKAINREHRVEVMVGGEFADEICGGWFALPDWFDAVSLPRLVLRAKALPRGRGDVAAAARQRMSRRRRRGPWPTSLAEWVRPEINEEYQAWRMRQESRLRASSAPHRYQRAVLSWLDGALAMNWEVCSFLKVRRAFPFLTAEVLEVLSACHPVELLGPGPKRLERQAFAGVVPERQLQRPDKGGWGGGDDKDLMPPGSMAMPASLGSVLSEELRPATPMQAVAVQVMSRFVDQVAATRP